MKYGWLPPGCAEVPFCCSVRVAGGQTTFNDVRLCCSVSNSSKDDPQSMDSTQRDARAILTGWGRPSAGDLSHWSPCAPVPQPSGTQRMSKRTSIDARLEEKM